jgi:WD40 repeat protein
VIIEWAESVQFNRSSTINSSNSQDILLCVLFLNQGKNIAVGSKDKNIYIYSTVGGKLVQTLAGHRASVCSLANFNNFFASGGDNGCGSLILWETPTYKMKRKINLHTAALTCVVDLLDGSHLATGGYDKKINIYNYKKGENAFEVNTCRSGVTSLVICEQSRKLVSAGLDSTLTIWNIFTKVLLRKYLEWGARHCSFLENSNELRITL